MTTSTSKKPFAVANAPISLFLNKEDYLSFKAAWKILANSEFRKFTPSMFAAYAILRGTDLYKVFSPNTREQFRNEPYHALLQALRHVPYLREALASRLAAQPSLLTAAQAAAFDKGLLIAAQQVEMLNLYGKEATAITSGTGQFKSENTTGAHRE